LASKIIDKEKADKVVLLGDHFDDFYDTVEMNKSTASWVKHRLELPHFTFLLGNHDAVYRWLSIPRCSGWDKKKHEAINSVLTTEDWNKFKLFEVVDGWLLTHAGLTAHNVHPKAKDIIKWLGIECEKAVKAPSTHWLLAAGRARYGSEDFGGITWCDANEEFVPIEGIKQCFGHTPLQGGPKWFGENNVCIDSHPGLQNFAIIENGKLSVHDV